MLHPAVMKLTSLIPRTVLLVIHGVFCALLIVDIVVTVTAIVGFNRKVRFLNSLSGGIRKYSDKIGSSIYGTVDVIKTRTTPAISMTQSDYTEFRAVFIAHRKEEHELSKKNRAEERQLIAKYASEGKQGIVNTSKAAVKAVKLKLPEARLLNRLQFAKDDDNAQSIQFLKQHYSDILGADSDEEFFDDGVQG